MIYTRAKCALGTLAWTLLRWLLAVPLGPICLLVQRYIYQLLLLSGTDILRTWRLRHEWMAGWIDYLFVGVEDYSMAVRAGMGWYSQRWRVLRLYIPDPWHVLLTCLIWWTWYTEWVAFQNKTTHCWTVERLSTSHFILAVTSNLLISFSSHTRLFCFIGSVSFYPCIALHLYEHSWVPDDESQWL